MWIALLALPLVAHLPAISPSDHRIRYIGRFDRHDPSVAVCQWSATEVRLEVRGKQLTADIEDKGHDYLQVVVDGVARPPLALTEKRDTYTVELGDDAPHVVRFVKRTEPFVGTVRYWGFDVPGGKLLPPTPVKRNLQFVGDSITCGFGNEGANQNEPFKPETENVYQTYATITARALGADAEVLAWSGRTMWPTNSMPEIYDRILPTEAGSDYDFRGPTPNAVVINLATNDFGRENPPEGAWTGAYEAFIRRLRGHFPHAHVYVTFGSMMSDDYPAGHKALTTVRGYLTRMVNRLNDPTIHLVEFDVQQMADGIGSGWHPNLVTHKKMADRLTQALRRDLGW